MTKRFDTIAKEKAALYKKETAAVEEFMRKNSAKSITQIFEEVEKNGHPKERALSIELKGKYTRGEFEFDDVMTLNSLYKSNYQLFINKDEHDE